MIEIGSNDALVVVDFQRDFCSGGALEIKGGDEIVPILNAYLARFRDSGGATYATRDWHPPKHVSFRDQGGMWPPHCVQGTEGAEFHPDLQLPEETKVISKATDPSREAYSGFDGTELAEDLRRKGIVRLFVGGLATDYCVKNTVLDALRWGFDAVLLIDAVRAVNMEPGDSEEAIREMVRNGASKAVLGDLKAG